MFINNDAQDAEYKRHMTEKLGLLPVEGGMWARVGGTPFLAQDSDTVQYVAERSSYTPDQFKSILGTYSIQNGYIGFVDEELKYHVGIENGENVRALQHAHYRRELTSIPYANLEYPLLPSTRIAFITLERYRNDGAAQAFREYGETQLMCRAIANERGITPLDEKEKNHFLTLDGIVSKDDQGIINASTDVRRANEKFSKHLSDSSKFKYKGLSLFRDVQHDGVRSQFVGRFALNNNILVRVDERGQTSVAIAQSHSVVILKAHGYKLDNQLEVPFSKGQIAVGYIKPDQIVGQMVSPEQVIEDPVIEEKVAAFLQHNAYRPKPIPKQSMVLFGLDRK